MTRISAECPFSRRGDESWRRGAAAVPWCSVTIAAVRQCYYASCRGGGGDAVEVADWRGGGGGGGGGVGGGGGGGVSNWR